MNVISIVLQYRLLVIIVWILPAITMASWSICLYYDFYDLFDYLFVGFSMIC